ncbi:putative GTP-binding protein EngB [Mitosporidium daphniae]|uniref:Putative GTP-binding protein EngB n=1 Tax=Mitosporidium daphniae TaxID=1485682 RepID=A0A098VV42_9MICR|nr:putative GTP-binding protein EngB [Mitosporidium daphniae]KGG52968.1 putative GTP-binding protein EngB [Mitosporidium daphniae]|eukprot:XP_013239395.1 putative GTP-binding protein EngB [Mitosporidium daphniae]
MRHMAAKSTTTRLPMHSLQINRPAENSFAAKKTPVANKLESGMAASGPVNVRPSFRAKLKSTRVSPDIEQLVQRLVFDHRQRRAAQEAQPLGNSVVIGFIGRSNVGKSSLLNALIGKRSGTAAGVSPIPGHTKAINIYRWITPPSVSDNTAGQRMRKDGCHSGHNQRGGSLQAHGRLEKEIFLIDMPGYGYVSQSSTARERLGSLAKAFIASPAVPLSRLFLLIDSRHGTDFLF